MDSSVSKEPAKPTVKSLWRKIILKQEMASNYKCIAVALDRDGKMWKSYTIISNSKMIDLVLAEGEVHELDGIKRSFLKEEADKYRDELERKFK